MVFWTGDEWIIVGGLSKKAHVDTPIPPTDGYDNANIKINYIKKTKELLIDKEEIIEFNRNQSNTSNKINTQNPPQYNPVKQERLANKNFTPLTNKNYDKFKQKVRDIEVKTEGDKVDQEETKELTQKEKDKLAQEEYNIKIYEFYQQN